MRLLMGSLKSFVSVNRVSWFHVKPGPVDKDVDNLWGK